MVHDIPSQILVNRKDIKSLTDDEIPSWVNLIEEETPRKRLITSASHNKFGIRIPAQNSIPISQNRM